MAGSGSAPMALRVLSVLLGIFMLFMAISKVGWFADATPLANLLREWAGTGRAMSRWYVEAVCLPGVEVFARLVPLGEFAVAAGLLLGVRVRLAAAVAIAMILNFHFAADVMFKYSYLTNAYGFPVLGGLLALAIGGGRLPFSVERR